MEGRILGDGERDLYRRLFVLIKVRHRRVDAE